jgi:hypothetical protein
MSDIFIGYKHEEKPSAKRLADALAGRGWDVWWDPKLRAGEIFDDAIEKALLEARCVVVLWSQRSVKSEYVKDEANYALELSKLIPVMIEEVSLPFRFRSLHTADLTSWDGSDKAAAFCKLVDDIAAVIGRPPAESGDEEEGAKATIEEHVRRPAASPGSLSLDTLADGSSGPEMVVIPAGSFEMGDLFGDGWDRESPVHTVSIARPFVLGRCSVTFEEYDRFYQATGRGLPSDSGWGRGRRAVINVSWHGARLADKSIG